MKYVYNPAWISILYLYVFYWYYFRVCPSAWMNLVLLWIACYEMWRFCSLLNAIQWYKLNTHNSNTIIQCQVLTALSVPYCKIRCDSENFHTKRHLRIKLFELAFSLHSLSVTFVKTTCFLSLSNCDTALAANSVSLKDLISGYVWIYNFKQVSALHFRRHQLGSFCSVVQLNM